MLQNATTLLNSQDLSNLWNASVYMHIYYPLEKQMAVQPAIIIYGKNKQQCNNSSVSTWKIPLQNKNCMIKRGLGQKNCTVKKSHQICNEKCAMCEWDHWNNIGVKQMWYPNEFVTSKMPQICIMCVMTFCSMKFFCTYRTLHIILHSTFSTSFYFTLVTTSLISYI